MVAAGHDAYRARPTRLMLNGEYVGVFTTIEEPGEVYLARIGLDPVGRSYKVNRGLHPRDDLDSYIEDFENTNASDWDRCDIAGLLRASSRYRTTNSRNGFERCSKSKRCSIGTRRRST